MESHFNPSSIPTSHINLSFLEDLPEYEHTKPYYISGDLPEDCEPSRTNIQYDVQYDIPVTNLRSIKDQLHLSTHGFQFIHIPDDIASLDIRGDCTNEYIEKMTAHVKDLLDASFALCYDCRVCICNGSDLTLHT